jgi:hypothetical protein
MFSQNLPAAVQFMEPASIGNKSEVYKRHLQILEHPIKKYLPRFSAQS